MAGRIKIVTPPAVEPVSLEEIKSHLRIDITDDDVYLTGLIPVARRVCERHASSHFITTTVEQTFDAFAVGGGYWNRAIRNQGPDPGNPIWLPARTVPIRLLRAPLLDVLSITYLDSNGISREIPPELIRPLRGSPPGVQPAYNATWPTSLAIDDAITVRYDVGYGPDPSDVPDPIRHAIKLLVGSYYENRESVTNTAFTFKGLPKGVDDILALEGWGADYS